MDAECPRRREVTVHRSQQRRNPFQVDLGADAKTPSQFFRTRSLLGRPGSGELAARCRSPPRSTQRKRRDHVHSSPTAADSLSQPCQPPRFNAGHRRSACPIGSGSASADRFPLCCQDRVFVVVVARERLVLAGDGWRVLPLGRVREWLLRSAGCWGVRPVTLDCRAVPACPPGPVLAVSRSRWR